MVERREREGDRQLRRTQSIIALVRMGFALIAGIAIGVVWTSGENSNDEFAVPGTDWAYSLWEAFAGALLLLVVVFVGGVAELVRAQRGRRFGR